MSCQICGRQSQGRLCQDCEIEQRAAERARADGGLAESQQSFGAIIPADTLADTIDAVNCLVNECKIHLDEDGLRISAVDPANVGMVELTLDTRAFEAYGGADGGTVGVNLERLGDVVGLADSGDLVHLDLDEQTRCLDIRAGGLEYDLALIDPETVRQEPDIPDLDLPARIVVEAGQLDRGLTAADLCSDHLALAADPEERAFRMAAEGDTDTAEVTVEGTDLVDAQVEAAVSSLFSLDYLDDMAGPMAGDVTVRLGDEYPAKLEWSYVEGHGEVTYALAPRVAD